MGEGGGGRQRQVNYPSSTKIEGVVTVSVDTSPLPLPSTTSRSDQRGRDLKRRAVRQDFRGDQPSIRKQSVDQKIVGWAAGEGHCCWWWMVTSVLSGDEGEYGGGDMSHVGKGGGWGTRRNIGGGGGSVGHDFESGSRGGVSKKDGKQVG